MKALKWPKMVWEAGESKTSKPEFGTSKALPARGQEEPRKRLGRGQEEAGKL